MANVQLQFRKLKWNIEHLTLAQLLDKYPLPQIVKITGDFHGELQNAVLFLHSVKPVRKVHGRLSCGKGGQISIPLDCASKVEVRSSNLKEVYESVEELCSAFPPHVRVVKGFCHESSGEIILNVGDKLQLKSIDKKKKKDKKLICLDQNGQKVELSKDCVATFQPLADGIEYYLADVLNKFKMPLNVQFVEPYYSMDEDARSVKKLICEPFHNISLERVSTLEAVKGTRIYPDGSHEMVQLSCEANVKLVACDNTFRNSAEYAKICETFNQDVNSDDIYTEPYEYIDDDAVIQSQTTDIKPYPKKPKPFIPPKPKSKNPTAVQHESDSVYDTVDIDEQESKDSKYPAFNPTYASYQRNENSVLEQLAKCLENRPNVLDKPHLPTKVIALPPVKSPDSTNTGSNPKHISNQYEKPFGVEQPIQSSKNRPKTLDKPRLPKKAVTLPKPTLPPSLFEPEGGKTATAKSFEDSNSKPDRASPSVVTLKMKKEEIYQAIAEYPPDLSGLNVADVGRLLECLGMGKHVEIFANELIDGSMLTSLDKSNLKSLGLSPFHVIKLFKFIRGWRPNLTRLSKY